MSVFHLDRINGFQGKKVLVLGDSMVDVYLRGKSSRLSPEAPVPVVDVHSRDICPGGAANAALTLCALGAAVYYVSVTGQDTDGQLLLDRLTQAGVNVMSVLSVTHRQTIVKSRVTSGNYTLLRYDSGTETPLDTATEQLLINQLREAYQYCHAVLVSDYDKGIVTPAVREALADLKINNPKYIAVDSKRLTFFRTLKPSLVKPNYEESIRLLDLPAITSYRMNQILSCPEVLYEKTAAEVTVVTLDSEGALVMEKDRCVYQAPALPVKSPHVAGAGDAFISTFLLAQLANADVAASTDLALAAAALAIQKEGTASCNNRELLAHFTQCEKRVGSMDALENLCALYKQQGRRIVFTNGCFDILHSGHVSYLNQARTLGDVLIVGVNNDASIRRIKGSQRPINPLQDRIHVLAGLTAVDHVISFGSEENDTPITLINSVKPDVFVKGGDYANKDLPEGPTVERHGGRIVILPLMPDRSTSRIIHKVHQTHVFSPAS